MNRQSNWRRRFIGGLLLSLVAGQLFADESKLRILTTIRPIQLIAAEVIGDSAQVDVLLAPNISPHDYQLRPSDRKKLAEANIVFWIGPAMETFLTPALAALPKGVKVASLQAEIGVKGDPHLWMDPVLAAQMGQKIADILSQLAPTSRQAMQANAARLRGELLAEDSQLHQQISAVKSPRGYMVVHDAYGRFESRYGLKSQIALTDTADLPPSAQHIARIQALLDGGEIACVMQEPLGLPKVLQTLLKGRQVRIETVDSLALKADSLSAFYRQLGASMLGCLQP